MIIIKKALVLAVGCEVLGSVAGSAHAAGQPTKLEEVIVTAQKHEENIQNVPLAISALTAQDLKVQGITSYEGVARSSPSITLTPYPTSSSLLILYMRGQGVADANQITTDGSVGLYEDGFYISRPQSATFDLADVQRVEILRGPQGTLYGRNTTGGAVNLVSKVPTGEFGFKQDFTFGTRHQFRSLTAIDLPKWHDLSSKVVLLKSSIDGYVQNAGSGHDFGEEEQKAGRLLLHWEPGDDFSADYFLEKGDLDSTPIWYQNASNSGQTIAVPAGYSYSGDWPYYADAGVPHSKTFRPIDLNSGVSDFEGHGLTLSWDVADNMTLKSLTGYRKLNWIDYSDFAGAYTADLGPGLTAVPIVARAYAEIHSHQFSQEFQIVGSNESGSINYVGGWYYFREGASNLGIGDSAAALPSPFGPFELFNSHTDRYVTADAKSQAIYGQVTWTPPILDQNLDLTFGARYTKDDRSATRDYLSNTFQPLPAPTTFVVGEADASNSLSYKRFNPTFTADYHWAQDVSTYLKVATGYKAGGSSEGSVPPLGNFKQTVKPEKVVSYEGGLKSYWLDHTLRVNVAVFESKFTDMQLNISINPNNLAEVAAFNAGKATVRGAEAELVYVPIDNLTLGLNYSYLHASFDKVEAPADTAYDPAQNPASPYTVGEDIKGIFVMPYVPKNSLNLTTDYTFYTFDTGSLSAHLDYRYQSKIFTTASAGQDVPGRDNYAIPGYGLLNGRLTVDVDLPRGDHVTVGFWGKNLAHKRYKVHTIGLGSNVAVYQAAFGTTAPAGFTSQAVAWNPPPSYGVDLEYKY